jgi:hypothetical protein
MNLASFEAQAAVVPSFRELQSQFMPVRDVNAQPANPAPAFAVWLCVSNLLQLHLMSLIMVGQNLEERHDQLGAQAQARAATR